MKKIIIYILILLSYKAVSQTKNFLDKNYIEVKGQAELEIIPNEIYLRIVLNENDYKGKGSLNMVEKAMFEKLEELGFDLKKDLTIRDLASNFKKYWLKTQDIHSNKVYILKTKDAKSAGKVIKELEKLKISNIFIDRLEHSEIDRFKQEVKISAIKVAKKKAEALCTAIGQTCGKALYIKELNIQPYKDLQGKAAGINIMIRGISSIKKSKLPEIQFEKISLSYSILVRFELN